MPQCQCPDGRALRRDLLGTNEPWSPTVDHIVPSAEGGRNDDRNKRAAHRRCNQEAAAYLNQPKGTGRGMRYQISAVYDQAMLDALITEKIAKEG